MAKKTDKKLNLEEEIKDLDNKWKRALADYQNLEKRIDQEKEEFVKFANVKLLMVLLPGLDSLETAEKHLKDQGLSLALKQLKDGLVNEGLIKIETAGKDFNPNLMECVQLVAGDDNKVISEVRPGYLLNGRVVRVAQVEVGKKDLEKDNNSSVK